MFSHMQELLSQQDIKTVRPLSVRMIFEDNHNWDAFPGNLEFSIFVNHLFKKYPEGFYVHLPEES